MRNEMTTAINGACGRMGQRLLALAHDDPELRVVAALEAQHHAQIGRDAGELAGIGQIGVLVRDELPIGTQVDVMIDFSSPEGTMAILPTCVARRIPLLIATTGHTPAQRRTIEEAMHETAILMTANTSLAVNVLLKLVRIAGEALAGKGFDVEIIEKHHRFKKDAPSGTALQFAQVVRQAMGQQHLRHGREGLVGERPLDEVGVHAIRVGDNVGEHTIIFGTLGETIELTQRATSRDCYARGALAAAKFLVGKPAGRYSMSDVLGI